MGKPIGTKGVILKLKIFKNKLGETKEAYQSGFIKVGDRSITLQMYPKAGMTLPEEIWVNVSSWDNKSNDL